MCVFFKFLNWLWHTTLATSPAHLRTVCPVAANNPVVFIWVVPRCLRLPGTQIVLNAYTCQMAKKGLKGTKGKLCSFLPPCLANTWHLMNVSGCDHNDFWNTSRQPWEAIWIERTGAMNSHWTGPALSTTGESFPSPSVHCNKPIQTRKPQRRRDCHLPKS